MVGRSTGSGPVWPADPLYRLDPGRRHDDRHRGPRDPPELPPVVDRVMPIGRLDPGPPGGLHPGPVYG